MVQNVDLLRRRFSQWRIYWGNGWFYDFQKKTKRVPSANPSIASQKIDANGKNSCIVVNDVSIFFCAKKMITHCETMAFQSRI